MANIDKRSINLFLELSKRVEDPSADKEDILFWCVESLMKNFNCTESCIHIIDKDKKNGYTIVDSAQPSQRNIPFAVKAKPELALYCEPSISTVLKKIEGYDRGVYRFEELAKILVPIDSDRLCLLFCELTEAKKQQIEAIHFVMKLFSFMLKPIVEKTEIYKLLYGLKEKRGGGIENMDETLSELAGSVAHLLNQPLTSLMGNVELLLKKGQLKEGQVTSLNKIYSDAERLADVIRKIETVNSYATEDYIGSAKILKFNDLSEIDSKESKVVTKGREKRVSKKLEIFLEFYKGVTHARTRQEITHQYAISINRMFPNLKLLLLTYKKNSGEFFLEYKEKGGYSRDFELSKDKIGFYKKIMDELTLKLYRFDDANPHVITIPLVIEQEKMGVAEFDFETEEISMFDLILLESMIDELVLALHRLKLAEKNRYLKDYVSNLIENTSSLIFVLDESHSVRTCNPAFEDAMSLAKVNMEGKQFIDFVPDKSHKTNTTKAIRECFQGKVIRKLDILLTNDEGEKLDTRFSLIPLPKVKNLRPEIIAIGQNITEVKQLENQIMQTEKLAYLGQMAASVAHELNNPLTSITVFTEYLLKKIRGDFGEAAATYESKLKQIFDNANRIHSFAKNLTSLARPTVDSLPEKLDLNNVIKESILFSDYEIKKNNVTVECKYSKVLPHVEGIKNQLHQVFINLIANASHAFDNSGGQIRILTYDHDKSFVRVDIIDEGKGIEQEIIDKIFEPFISTRKEEGGTGLGLSIVKRIIDDHRGKIEVDSKPGGGTTFKVFLPKFAE